MEARERINNLVKDVRDVYTKTNLHVLHIFFNLVRVRVKYMHSYIYIMHA